MEQMCFFLPSEPTRDEIVAALRERQDKLRRSFFKRNEIEMKELEDIEKEIIKLENANLDGKDRAHSSWEAYTLDRAASG